MREVFKNRFLAAYANQGVNYKGVLIAMFMCMIIVLAICGVYYLKSRKRGFSLKFAVSLMTMSLITVAIVLTLESSIVVSLGMIGVLSVVRYRTATKSALEMLYLFWSISVGIICGAGLYFIAIPLTLLLGIVVIASDGAPGAERNKILALDGCYPYDEARLKAVLNRHVRWYNVRTENIHNGDVNLVIEVRRIRDDGNLIRELREISDFHDVSLQVQEGVVD